MIQTLKVPARPPIFTTFHRLGLAGAALVAISTKVLIFPRLSAVSCKCGLRGDGAGIFIPIGHLVEGAPAHSFLLLTPVALGSTQFPTSAGDRAFGLVIGNLEVPLVENPLLVRF